MMTRLFLLIGFVFLTGCTDEVDVVWDVTCDVADECIYYDSAMGETLTWQGCPAGQSGEDCSTGSGLGHSKTHAEALTYCEYLSWGGFDDWVLPNIDELRSLIRGCPHNELGEGNTCSITHQCSYSVDNDCTQSSCGGCTSSASGCYWPADLPGECSYFSSSSLQSASDAYGVNFLNGNVYDVSLHYRGKVRCVRSRP